MILFESFSAGAMALFIAFCAVLILVGLYTYTIWPLTEWDLVNVHMGRYSTYITGALLGIFLIPSIVSFWFLSGAAWSNRRTPQPTPRSSSPRPRPSR
jgi:H+/Cl- antiporter ClcA